MASETIATFVGLRAAMTGQHRHSSTSSWSYSACSNLVEQSITHRNVSQEHFFLSKNVYKVIGVLHALCENLNHLIQQPVTRSNTNYSK